MFLSESEGTGIRMSESEGTGIRISESEGTGIRMSESEGTGIKLSETEGTGITSRAMNRILMAAIFMLCFSQVSLADKAYLYQIDQNVYEGVIVDNKGNTQLIEGLVDKNILTALVISKESVDDGTGEKSVDDGTGNKSVDDGTGNKSVDDGTGLDSVDDGTGDVITIDLNCSAAGNYHTESESQDAVSISAIEKLYINGEDVNCNFK